MVSQQGMAEHFLRVALVAVSVLSVILGGEVAIRVYYWVADGIPVSQWHRFLVGNFGATQLDAELGWRTTENYQSVRSEKTLRGKSYTVQLSQDKHGFRLFGDVSSKRKKALVIGDSFTHAREVSDSKAYYAVLQNLLGLEIFAYGVENYGTLQEYMILDRYFDLVRPDLVIWQYCFNDLVNNDEKLEGRTNLHVDFRQRPYWVDGAPAMAMPKSALGNIRRFAYRYSRFLVFILSRIGKLFVRYNMDRMESEIARLGANHPDFRRAVETTNDLMMRVRRRVGSVPIIAFNCKSVDPYNAALQDISRLQGIMFVDEVAKAVQTAAEGGEDVFHADGEHWAEEGHRIAGHSLAQHLKELALEGKLPVLSYAARESVN